MTKRAITWLDANAATVDADDLACTKRALRRVLAGNSELRSLWDDNGPDTPWHAGLRILLARLGADTGPAGAPPLEAVKKPEGRAAEAEAENERAKDALITFLCARGLEPTEQQRTRIRGSRDPAELRTWLGRVAAAGPVEAVLTGEG